ncbi:MAG: deoxyribonuclease IV [Elusimicrobia bacterium]|nr:deoxyribonuclease IV [Elusimicrobiota bacterium]
MRLGVHCSVGKGLENTVKEAVALNCETIQIFSRSPRSWGRKEFDLQEVEEFKTALKHHRIFPLFVHMLYLPNLASSDKKLYKKSVDVLIDELKRCRILNAECLIIHPGRYTSGSFETGIKNIITAINFSFSKVSAEGGSASGGKNETILLLENLAGGKTDIGWKFEEIRQIIKAVKDKKRIGVCLDTAHLFAAGYDVSKKGFDNTVKEFDEIVGLKYLKLIHLNDSLGDIGSRIDRHTHIGEGKIGIKGFEALIQHPKIKNIPGIIETPRGDLSLDRKNLKKLREIMR